MGGFVATAAKRFHRFDASCCAGQSMCRPFRVHGCCRNSETRTIRQRTQCLWPSVCKKSWAVICFNIMRAGLNVPFGGRATQSTVDKATCSKSRPVPTSNIGPKRISLVVPACILSKTQQATCHPLEYVQSGILKPRFLSPCVAQMYVLVVGDPSVAMFNVVCSQPR